MTIKILLFGIARDIAGGPTLDIQISNGQDVGSMMQSLKKKYPAFNDLSSLMVAVNNEYADDNKVLNENDEIALIPPVSGG